MFMFRGDPAGATSTNQSGYGSNGNEVVINPLQMSKLEFNLLMRFCTIYRTPLITKTPLIPKAPLISPVGRLFANDPGDMGSIPGCVIPKTLKMVLDTSLFNTQQYKVRFEGKVEQSRERRSFLPDTLV